MYKQRDIVMVPMSYTDLAAQKMRPALVLSSDDYNNKSTDLLAVMVTSTRNRRPYDVIIQATDISSGVLPKQSYVRTDRIFSIAQKLVVKSFGNVTDEFYRNIYQTIDELISLPERI